MSEIRVLYEDDYLLVIDKPAGITVNRADTTKDEETVQDWAENKLKIQNSRPQTPERSNGGQAEFTIENESDFYKRGGIVHRLDKETSGILLIAKNETSFKNLQSQFKQRQVHKTYIALVHGLLTSPEGEINVPVGRLPWNRKRFGVLAGGKEALTRYKVLNVKYLDLGKRKEALSLLELNPETGRTHQIRVHLKYFNHPIFADPLYAGRKTARDDRRFLPRVFLHAKGISLVHPKTGERVNFEAPLPFELDSFFKNLRG